MMRFKIPAWVLCLFLGWSGGWTPIRPAEAAEDPSIGSPGEAIEIALSHPEVSERLDDVSSLRVTARFVEAWRVWMVECFEEDHRLAFATINTAGKILEVGPDTERDTGRRENDDQIARLRSELEHARRTGNKAEARELLELLEARERESDAEVSSSAATLPGFRAYGSVGFNVLMWDPERLRRHDRLVIERRGQGATWSQIHQGTPRQGRWFDDEVRPGETYRYRAALKRGDQLLKSESEVFEATPLKSAPEGLPIYTIRLPEEAWASMRERPTDDIESDGEFGFEGKHYPIKMRLRGASTRHPPKKSFRIEFLHASPFSLKVIYLKAEPMDHTMQQEKLSCDLFKAAGYPASEAGYVQVILNGRYQGVYLDIEPLRAPFKQAHGLDPEGSLIRASTFQHQGWDRPIGELRGKRGSLEALKVFLDALHAAPRGDFTSWLKGHVDWPRLRTYLILQILCHRSEVEADDYFFYQNPGDQRWRLLPWDHNNGNFGVVGFGNHIREPHISIFSQSIQDIGWGANYSYVLNTRCFNQPTLLADYLEHLEEAVHQWLLSDRLAVMVDQNYAALKEVYPLDPYRTPFRGEDPFLGSAEALKTFIKRHAGRLLDQIDAERRRDPTPLQIASFADDGQEGWVEVKNVADRGVRLSRYGLVTKTDGVNGFLTLPERELAPGQTFRLKVAVDHYQQGDREGNTPRPGQATLSSQGGILGLVRRHPRERETSKEGLLRERPVDLHFYGPTRAARED